MTDPHSSVQQALAGLYEIQREIGRGGMAIVYLARDLRHDRDVAIKALRPELSLAGPAARFLQEIRITDEVRHPRILAQLDAGEVDGVPYYVTPYVAGGSLEDRLRREKPLTLDDTIRIARQVAEALDFAHGKGVIHRDIKPANILLDGTEAIIADFGIARLLTVVSADRLTEYGMSIGTPEYMSPEQCAGERHIDHRSDVYSLGCVVYEMLVGEPPFTGPTKQAISAKHQHETPPSLRVVRHGLPQYVQDAVETALAKTPADRFASAGEFVRALSTPRLTAAERGWRRRATIGSAAALVIAVGGWRAVSSARRAGEARTVASADTTRI
ncbi:MAG: serine/threonine-protein kinase, partial [Gemmatimonadales bacterium]